MNVTKQLLSAVIYSLKSMIQVVNHSVYVSMYSLCHSSLQYLTFKALWLAYNFKNPTLAKMFRYSVVDDKCGAFFWSCRTIFPRQLKDIITGSFQTDAHNRDRAHTLSDTQWIHQVDQNVIKPAQSFSDPVTFVVCWLSCAQRQGNEKAVCAIAPIASPGPAHHLPPQNSPQCSSLAYSE